MIWLRMLCDCTPITLIRSFLLSANLRSSDISWVDTKKQLWLCFCVRVCLCVFSRQCNCEWMNEWPRTLTLTRSIIHCEFARAICCCFWCHSAAAASCGGVCFIFASHTAIALVAAYTIYLLWDIHKMLNIHRFTSPLLLLLLASSSMKCDWSGRVLRLTWLWNVEYSKGCWDSDG